MDISVIVPAFNESDMIGETIDRIRKATGDVELIVIDDGSSDDTYDIAKERGVIALKQRNKGKGAAFRAGIERSTKGIIVQVDADCQFLPEDIPKLIRPIQEGKADVTLGSRFMQGSDVQKGSVSSINRIGNFFDSFMSSLVCMKWISDVQAGFKAFDSSCLRSIKFTNDHFGYEPEVVILAIRSGYRVVDVPIRYDQRRGGRSNIDFITDAIRIAISIFRARFIQNI